MKTLHKTMKPVSIILIICIVSLSVPFQPCLAALIGTETILNETKGHQARYNIGQILGREEVQMALKVQGISPREAKARVDALTDAELLALEKKLDQLPAGGDGFSTFVIALVFVFIILLATDIAGYTDVFPFVKKTVSK
jgi:hypothetical protein